MKFMKKMGLTVAAAGLAFANTTVQAHGTHAEDPWDYNYSGTWDLTCDSATYLAGAVFWVNGSGILPIGLGSMTGQCVDKGDVNDVLAELVPSYPWHLVADLPGGVIPDPTWLKTNVTDQVVGLCQNFDNLINQIGTLTGFVEACDDIANRATAQFILTMLKASPQPWDKYYVDWMSTTWHLWGNTYIYPNPLANDARIDYVTLGDETGTTGNTIIGWATDRKANGLTAKPGKNPLSFPLNNNMTLDCDFQAQGQTTHHEYTNNDTVNVTNNDIVGGGCIVHNDDYLSTFNIESSGFIIAGDVLTELSGVRVSKTNTLAD